MTQYEMFRLSSGTVSWSLDGPARESLSSVQTSGVALRGHRDGFISTNVIFRSDSDTVKDTHTFDFEPATRAVTLDSTCEVDGHLRVVGEVDIDGGGQGCAIDVAGVGSELHRSLEDWAPNLAIDRLTIAQHRGSAHLTRVDGSVVDWVYGSCEVAVRARRGDDNALLVGALVALAGSTTAEIAIRGSEVCSHLAGVASVDVVRIGLGSPVVLRPLAVAQVFRTIMTARTERPRARRATEDYPNGGLFVMDCPQSMTSDFAPVDHTGVPTSARRVLDAQHWYDVEVLDRSIDRHSTVHLGRSYRDWITRSPSPAVRHSVVCGVDPDVEPPRERVEVDYLSAPQYVATHSETAGGWRGVVASEVVANLCVDDVVVGRCPRGVLHVEISDLLARGVCVGPSTITPLRVSAPPVLLPSVSLRWE